MAGNKVQVAVGKDKNGKFYVSVPKGKKVPRGVYEFLTGDCKANYVKNSNNYFGIAHNPEKGLTKRLGDAYVVVDKTLMGDTSPKQKKAAAATPQAGAKAKKSDGFTVMKEALTPAQKNALSKKGAAVMDEALVVRGTALEDGKLRDVMKEKYGAAGLKEADATWSWILATADVKNQVSVYKELNGLRNLPSEKEGAQKRPNASAKQADALEGFEFKTHNGSVVVSSLKIKEDGKLLKAVKAAGLAFNREAGGMVCPPGMNEQAARALIAGLVTDTKQAAPQADADPVAAIIERMKSEGVEFDEKSSKTVEAVLRETFAQQTQEPTL